MAAGEPCRGCNTKEISTLVKWILGVPIIGAIILIIGLMLFDTLTTLLKGV
jgi:hypothetical protein